MVVAFLEGGLAAQERSAVQNHLGACSTCAEVLTWAAADRANGSRSAGREGRPFLGVLAPGSHVERYQVLGAVGRGGMGEVYAAYHPDLDRRIALKVVSESEAAAPERRARLLHEARVIARLSHPNVVAVYDAGTVGDRVYIAMEFVEGKTVDRWLRSTPRGWREILDVFIAAGRGLAAVHAAGIVHRDFKPHNVMIGRDGSVRVMDFGLARWTGEPIESADVETVTDSKTQIPTTVTKTGALVGTLAYMAPEQYRSEKVDARADQFSFAVALHEALYGNRPAVAHSAGLPDGEIPASSSDAPTWLRAVISRGLAEQRNERFPSMEDLIAALRRGRARPRRRAIGASIGLAVVLVAAGGWRAAAGTHIRCGVPIDRLASAWSGRDDARRQSIHRAFRLSNRPNAESAWQRVARTLDDYVQRWSEKYVQTCEATHVRGEQSSEALDLRMACLNDNLDQVRALSGVLAGADGAALGHAVVAVQDLPTLSRCDDIALLRSAVPLPRDQRTLDAVQSLRSSLRDAQALRDIGNFRKAGLRAAGLRPRAEATGYAPVLAEVLELVGCAADYNGDPLRTEATLHEALFAAEAGHDDLLAAKVASDLVDVVGLLGRPREAEVWLRLSESILNRLGPGHDRIRAWAKTNFGNVMQGMGDFARAERLATEAVELKEKALGKDHPDVALSLGNLSSILEEEGQAEKALVYADRACDILARNGDRDSEIYASKLVARGEALVDLGRAADAEASFERALRIFRMYGENDRSGACALQGLGNARLAQGHPDAAIAPLEDALRIRDTDEPIKWAVAETRFTLARALWESDGDRRRALGLAKSARAILATINLPRRQKAVVDWLAQHPQVKK
jgi:serine/threonine protein kinase